MRFEWDPARLSHLLIGATRKAGMPALPVSRRLILPTRQTSRCRAPRTPSRPLLAWQKRRGVKRLVLLSGRGEAEAQACEAIVQESGLEWTIVRASWFNQNFSEGAFIDMVLNGAITLPAGDQVEPFVDVDDIADVAVAALTEDNHNGRIYEVTGPRLMTFADVAKDLSRATGREISFIDVPHKAFITEMESAGAPEDVVWMLDYLFATVLDGRNAHLTDGVQQALGRPPKDFAAFAEEVARTGIWEER